MARYFSEQLNRFVECEVVWNGTDALLGDYPIRQWDVYQRGHGGRDDFILKREIAASPVAQASDLSWRTPAMVKRCACGRPVPAHDARLRCSRCPRCREKRRSLRRFGAA